MLRRDLLVDRCLHLAQPAVDAVPEVGAAVGCGAGQMPHGGFAAAGADDAEAHEGEETHSQHALPATVV